MDARTLPILVQPQVLFPGTMLPLGIWAGRHRRLIKDVVATDKLVGIVSLPYMDGADRVAPRVGHVGTLARVMSLKKLPSRRIRIVVEGIERFSVQKVVDLEELYLRCEVAPYSDLDESLALLSTFAEEVRQLYSRYQKASRKIADAKREKPVQLPADPIELSMQLPAILALEEDVNQRFLASRSTLMRLRELSALLAPAASTAEASAEVHARASSNGHGSKRS
jgi:Lon protease-like protein